MSASDSIMNNPKGWVRKTLSELGNGLYERDNTLAMTLLTVMSGQSVFLYGPPGTAKSLIARRISCVFEDAVYFEYLMQRFSTPEEVFGPISISELKNDNYVRKTENYLPTADIAFLDEIWKSSPAILNTLLTIINERKFKNGTKVEDAPLKAIVAASNEFPARNGGLDALYDRFIVRLFVNPMSERKSFEMMLSDNSVKSYVEVSNPLTQEEWADLIDASNRVILPSEVLDAINEIRQMIQDYNSVTEGEKIYVSDRRWQKAAAIMKTAALLNGRGSATPADVLILKNCLWSEPGDKVLLDGFIEEAVSRLSGGMSDKFTAWKEEFAKLEKEARDKCRPTSRNYKEPVTVNGIGCYPLALSNGPNGMTYTVYVPFGPKKIGETYFAYGRESAGKRSEYNYKVVTNDGVEAGIRFNSDNTIYNIPLNAVNSRVPADTLFTYRRTLANLIANLGDMTDAMLYTSSVRQEEYDSPFIENRDLVRIFDAMDTQIREMGEAMTKAEDLKQYLDNYAS